MKILPAENLLRQLTNFDIISNEVQKFKWKEKFIEYIKVKDPILYSYLLDGLNVKLRNDPKVALRLIEFLGKGDLICGRVMNLAKFDYRSYGKHFWVEADGYVYDLLLLVKIPRDVAYDLGYSQGFNLKGLPLEVGKVDCFLGYYPTLSLMC